MRGRPFNFYAQICFRFYDGFKLCPISQYLYQLAAYLSPHLFFLSDCMIYICFFFLFRMRFSQKWFSICFYMTLIQQLLLLSSFQCAIIFFRSSSIKSLSNIHLVYISSIPIDFSLILTREWCLSKLRHQ